MPIQNSATPVPFFRLGKLGNSLVARQPKIIGQAPNRSGSLGPHSEFYFQAGGSNLNSGTTNSNSASYTSTNGNWSTVTNQFIPTDGTNPVDSGVKVGDFGSLYIDGATVGVYIARITNVVNAANGPITFSTAFVAGTAPTTSATARSLKVGGAMVSPSNATGFPLLNGLMRSLRNLNDDRVRVNFKNDQTYTFGGNNVWAGAAAITVQGYSQTPGDGGKAIWSSNATSGTDFIMGNGIGVWIDIIFQNTAVTGNVTLIAMSGGHMFIRCVFRDARFHVFDTTNAVPTIYDCEFYNWNRVNSTACWAILSAGTGCFVYGSYFHDCTATQTTQGAITHTGQLTYIQNCVFHRIKGYGLNNISSSTGGCHVINCDFLDIGFEAILFNGASIYNAMIVRNSNFLRCRRAIQVACTLPGSVIADNNGYGSGSMANALPDILVGSLERGKIVYPPDTTPWSAPTTGDFTPVSPYAIGAGYAKFTEVDGTNTGTVSFPDVGAASASSVGSPVWAGEAFTCPSGFIGQSYQLKQSFQIPLTFTLYSGSLPTGLSLSAPANNSFLISGTPTALGTFSFVLRGTEAGGAFANASFEITILDDPDQGSGAVGGG